MGTIMEYIQWRGDLNLIKDPFNDIDALILALLSYLSFNNIVPGVESNKSISLMDSSAQYFSNLQTDKKTSTNINPTASPSLDAELLELLKITAASPRFKDIQLSGYEENRDYVVGRQFGAITYTLPNAKREKVIAFRGTDNSLIGWKEDFEIAYMQQIPAQESARKYLKRVINIFSGKVTICGHSKGGNLAVYASSKLDFIRRSKLHRIINFDGPGFDFSFVPRTSFADCEKKVCNYVPEESIVGMLLEQIGNRIVILSSAHGIDQHNAANWKVEQTSFLHGDLSSTSDLFKHTLNSWIEEMPLAKRAIFTEALFEILGASEGKTLTAKDELKELNDIFKKYSKLDKETKDLLSEVFSALTAKTKAALSTAIKENLQKII